LASGARRRAITADGYKRVLSSIALRRVDRDELPKATVYFDVVRAKRNAPAVN
jgi:hypothetical protein